MSTQMHIGFVGNISPPIGGAEVFLGQFFKHFLTVGRSGVLVRWRKQVFTYFPERVVRVYAPRGTVRRRKRLEVHYLYEALQRRPYERYHAYDRRVSAHYHVQADRTKEIFRRARVGLIHAHMVFPNLLFATIAAERLAVPLVLTVHGLLEFRLLDGFRSKYPGFARQVERCFARADVVVAVSDEIAQQCVRRGARRVVKISGGVDTRVFRPRPKAEGRDIVFVGSVRNEKGASLLIQAFERMNGAAGGDLVFAGRQLLGGPVAERARRNPRIHFLGEQDAAGVRRAIARARMVVLPSLSEGLPMSVLEAMASQKPVLVTATGELAHLIRDGDNGFLLGRRTVGTLARRIQDVAECSDLRRIGESARRTARLFDIRVVVRQYDALYRSLLP